MIPVRTSWIALSLESSWATMTGSLSGTTGALAVGCVHWVTFGSAAAGAFIEVLLMAAFPDPALPIKDQLVGDLAV